MSCCCAINSFFLLWLSFLVSASSFFTFSSWALVSAWSYLLQYITFLHNQCCSYYFLHQQFSYNKLCLYTSFGSMVGGEQFFTVPPLLSWFFLPCWRQHQSDIPESAEQRKLYKIYRSYKIIYSVKCEIQEILKVICLICLMFIKFMFQL